jgi:hypothetical protein
MLYMPSSSSSNHDSEDEVDFGKEPEKWLKAREAFRAKEIRNKIVEEQRKARTEAAEAAEAAEHEKWLLKQRAANETRKAKKIRNEIVEEQRKARTERVEAAERAKISERAKVAAVAAAAVARERAKVASKHTSSGGRTKHRKRYRNKTKRRVK